jgi:hypothetical protein
MLNFSAQINKLQDKFLFYRGLNFRRTARVTYPVQVRRAERNN